MKEKLQAAIKVNFLISLLLPLDTFMYFGSVIFVFPSPLILE